jgi:hypothetical protein
MKKPVFGALLSLFSAVASAECTDTQSNAKINITIEVLPENVKAGGNHGYMDKVTIQVPLSVEGISLASIELTEGEVAGFWIPLAYEVNNDVAEAEFVGYKSEMKDFEVSVQYESEQCQVSMQTMVYAYNQRMQFAPSAADRPTAGR